MDFVEYIDPDKVPKKFYKNRRIRKKLEAGQSELCEPRVPFDQLNSKQKFIIKFVNKFLHESETKQRQTPLRLGIFGTAGTGKTLVLSHLKRRLQLKSAADPSFKFHILSFTGMASHNAGGKVFCHCKGNYLN